MADSGGSVTNYISCDKQHVISLFFQHTYIRAINIRNRHIKFCQAGSNKCKYFFLSFSLYSAGNHQDRREA